MDKYDEAIEYLVARPEETGNAWIRGALGVGLFGFCTPDGRIHPGCGCLTMVKSGPEVAFTSSLTDAIRADNRIHEEISDLTKALLSTDSPDARRAILQPYAEWQRRMDREIRGIV